MISVDKANISKWSQPCAICGLDTRSPLDDDVWTFCPRCLRVMEISRPGANGKAIKFSIESLQKKFKRWLQVEIALRKDS